MTGLDTTRFIQDYIIRRSGSLFDRDRSHYDKQLSESIGEQQVLVIGGAGTIGSSFVRALLGYAPRSVVIVDTNENGLTELVRSLRSDPGLVMPPHFVTYPMDFGSPIFELLLQHYGGFDIVANFAAHKHVRSEKDAFSVAAMLDNNVLKAHGLLELLKEYPPKHFFCVSTDKAANPVNIMGASKKLMERLILSYAPHFSVTTARFANVAFSNGSLLDGYLHRLAQGQAITCPKAIRRFFVSPAESGHICLLACMLGRTGDVFFPKLGEEAMISFEEITRDFFQYLGIEIYDCTSEEEARNLSQAWTPGRPYPVYFFESDTSGEKPYEEFFTESENPDFDRFECLGVLPHDQFPDPLQTQDMVSSLRAVIFEKNSLDKKAAILEILQQYLPEFQHIEKGKNLDSKM